MTVLISFDSAWEGSRFEGVYSERVWVYDLFSKRQTMPLLHHKVYDQIKNHINSGSISFKNFNVTEAMFTGLMWCLVFVEHLLHRTLCVHQIISVLFQKIFMMSLIILICGQSHFIFIRQIYPDFTGLTMLCRTIGTVTYKCCNVTQIEQCRTDGSLYQTFWGIWELSLMLVTNMNRNRVRTNNEWALELKSKIWRFFTSLYFYKSMTFCD